MAIICGSGCRGDSTSYGVTESASLWTIKINDPEAIPGIHAATVTSITLQAGPPEGVSFVVWSDLPNGGSGSGGGQVGGASYKGHHRATDGRRVDFHAETTDGKTGTITIAEVSYDLAGGALFLVSTQKDQPTVAQIDMDASTLPKKRDQLIELAVSNDDIRAFFEEHGRKGGDSE
jgi:hypothetical protein